jgi:hypothetical protein
MKVLFFMRHPGYVRNFESVLRLLAERGNQIHVAFDSTRTRWLNDANPLDQLCERYPLVTWEHSPPRGRRHRTLIPRALRLCLDYLRYLHPEYANAPKLRARAASRLPWPARFVLSSWLTRSPSRLAWIEGRLRALEKSGSVGRARLDFIGAVKPDVVLVTPYVGLGSDQVEYVRAARRLRIPSALCVASWDNLTNKGLIHEIPDLVTVWNEAQRLEAIGLHGVPAERVIATGAHSYDHWFEWTPRTDRATFCAQVGLSPEQPIVLYLCSSPFVAPIEAPFGCEPATGISLTPASSFVPIHRTALSGTTFASTTSGRSPSGPDRARILSTRPESPPTSTLSTTARQWSESTRARSSKAPSSAVPCIRSPLTNFGTPRRGLSTSPISSATTGCFALPANSMSTWGNYKPRSVPSETTRQS